MEKYIWKIIGKIGFVFNIFFIITFIIFVFFSSYQNIQIFNDKPKEGIITDKNVYDSQDSAYQSYIYTVRIRNKNYYTGTSIREEYDIGSKVKGYTVGESSFNLIYVNNQKVGSKYSLFDYFCFLSSILIILIVIYKIKKRYYEKNSYLYHII